jgi:ubiquinone/menaquinone biosynthesis C-methylase UbiE
MARPTVHDQNTDQAAYWNGPTGRRWVDKQETQDVRLAPISQLLFDRAHLEVGERVIDIGCGCGATTIELARRVGPLGHVLGVDISAPMLSRARKLTPPNLKLNFINADATVYPFDRGNSNLLFSRFGVMFFADPDLSFANMRTALRPEGRVIFACWREPRMNPWMTVPLQEAYKHVPRLPEVAPDAPGPFAFASEKRVRGILSEAGFSSIATEPCQLFLDLAVGRGLEAAVSGAFEIGPVSRAVEGQEPKVLNAVADSIRKALAPVEKDGSVLLGASVWIVIAGNAA